MSYYHWLGREAEEHFVENEQTIDFARAMIEGDGFITVYPKLKS